MHSPRMNPILVVFWVHLKICMYQMLSTKRVLKSTKMVLKSQQQVILLEWILLFYFRFGRSLLYIYFYIEIIFYLIFVLWKTRKNLNLWFFFVQFEFTVDMSGYVVIFNGRFGKSEVEAKSKTKGWIFLVLVRRLVLQAFLRRILTLCIFFNIITMSSIFNFFNRRIFEFKNT